MDLTLNDDEEALDFALSFLDEFEPLVAARDEGIIDTLSIAHLQDDGARLRFTDAAVSTNGVAQAPSAQAASKRNPKANGKLNPNRARDEQKKELLYLRKKVVEMEQQLQELKQAGDRSSTTSSLESTRLVTSKPSVAQLTRGGRIRATTGTQFVWEEIASRQYAERHKAELENVNLKLMLEGQIKVAKSLEGILKKRSTTQMLEMYRESTMPLSKRSNHSGAEEDDTELFEMLLADLDKSPLEVDAIFDANGLNKTENSFQDAIVRTSKKDGIYLEVFANKNMPFDIHSTSNAVWLHMTGLQERIPTRSYYGRKPMKMETTDDTIVESYGVELLGKRTNAHLRVRTAMRRFVEEDRILIAWRMVYDPVEFSSQPTSGIRFYENGYIVIKRPTTRSPDFSLMQTCFVMTPERFGTGSWNEDTVGRFSNFLVDASARNIYFSHQLIENFLLDEALKRQGSMQ